jgi:hypothetical protein
MPAPRRIFRYRLGSGATVARNRQERRQLRPLPLRSRTAEERLGPLGASTSVPPLRSRTREERFGPLTGAPRLTPVPQPLLGVQLPSETFQQAQARQQAALRALPPLGPAPAPTVIPSRRPGEFYSFPPDMAPESEPPGYVDELFAINRARLEPVLGATIREVEAGQGGLRDYQRRAIALAQPEDLARSTATKNLGELPGWDIGRPHAFSLVDAPVLRDLTTVDEPLPGTKPIGGVSLAEAAALPVGLTTGLAAALKRQGLKSAVARAVERGLPVEALEQSGVLAATQGPSVGNVLLRGGGALAGGEAAARLTSAGLAETDLPSEVQLAGAVAAGLGGGAGGYAVAPSAATALGAGGRAIRAIPETGPGRALIPRGVDIEAIGRAPVMLDTLYGIPPRLRPAQPEPLRVSGRANLAMGEPNTIGLRLPTQFKPLGRDGFEAAVAGTDILVYRNPTGRYAIDLGDINDRLSLGGGFAPEGGPRPVSNLAEVVRVVRDIARANPDAVFEPTVVNTQLTRVLDRLGVPRSPSEPNRISGYTPVRFIFDSDILERALAGELRVDPADALRLMNRQELSDRFAALERRIDRLPPDSPAYRALQEQMAEVYRHWAARSGVAQQTPGVTEARTAPLPAPGSVKDAYVVWQAAKRRNPDALIVIEMTQGDLALVGDDARRAAQVFREAGQHLDHPLGEWNIGGRMEEEFVPYLHMTGDLVAWLREAGETVLVRGQRGGRLSGPRPSRGPASAAEPSGEYDPMDVQATFTRLYNETMAAGDYEAAIDFGVGAAGKTDAEITADLRRMGLDDDAVERLFKENDADRAPRTIPDEQEQELGGFTESGTEGIDGEREGGIGAMAQRVLREERGGYGGDPVQEGDHVRGIARNGSEKEGFAYHFTPEWVSVYEIKTGNPMALRRDSIRNLSRAPNTPADATVRRARMTEQGEVVEEDTFATEREIGGIREQQGAMFEGQGGGGLAPETAGPLFRQGEAAGPPLTPAEQTILRDLRTNQQTARLNANEKRYLAELESRAGAPRPAAEGAGGAGQPPSRPPTAQAAPEPEPEGRLPTQEEVTAITDEPFGGFTRPDGMPLEGGPPDLGASDLGRLGQRGAPPPPDIDGGSFSRELTTVPVREVEMRPELFQARDADAGSAFGERRVDELVRAWDDAEFEPPHVVRDPESGKYIVYRGHHRTEAFRRVKGAGAEMPVYVVNADLRDPDQLARIVAEADASNFKTALPNYREKVRAVQRAFEMGADTDEVALRLRMTPGEVDGYADAARMGRQVIDRVTAEPTLEPFARELGRARRLYGVSEEEAAAWFKRIADGPKGQRPTQSALRETIEKFGAQWEMAQATRAFAGFEDLGGQRGGILEVLAAATKARTKLEKQRNAAISAQRHARRLAKSPAATAADASAAEQTADLARREQARIEAELAAADEDVLRAFRAQQGITEPPGPSLEGPPPPPDGPTAGAAMPGFEDETLVQRIKRLDAELAAATSRPGYDPNDPDIQRLITEVNALKAELREAGPDLSGLGFRVRRTEIVEPPRSTARAGAAPSGEGPAPPPRDPPAPPSASSEPPRRPPRDDIAELGYDEADRLLESKREVIRRPGKLTQVPGLSHLLSTIFPNVRQADVIVPSYTARQAAIASLETRFAAMREASLTALEDAWKNFRPRYSGPADNPFKNTLKDFFDNPEHYAGVTAEMDRAKRVYDAISMRILNHVRERFGVDILPFDVDKEGWVYLATVQAKDNVDDAIQRIADGYHAAGVSGSGARAKTRYYEGAYQRFRRHPGWRAETDLRELTAIHDRALAHMAGGEVFKRGTEGLTRVEARDIVHPGLREARDDARRRMAELRQKIERAETRLASGARVRERLERLRAREERRTAPVYARIDALGEEWGPELSFLSGQAREIERRARVLESQLLRTKARTADLGITLQLLRTEADKLAPRLARLLRAYEAANLEPYVLSKHTYRYHLADVAADIDQVLLSKSNISAVNWALDAADEARLFTFAADFGPLTAQQGFFAALFNPLGTARSLRGVVKELLDGSEVARIAQAEADLVQRYTEATGRAFGEIGQEFRRSRQGIERLPPARPLNRRIIGGVEVLRYNLWKQDRALLKWLNPKMSDNVADAEAANFSSKFMPALNPAERGVSTLRAKIERGPIISPSFYAAPAGLAKDFAAGTAKLIAHRSPNPARRWHSLSGREQLAVYRGLSAASMLAMAGMVSYIASGYSPEEAVKRTLNINSPRFLSVALGRNRYVPIGGPFRSFIRAILPRRAFGSPVPVPFAGVPRWTQGKLAPIVRTPYDLYRNEDYLGRRIRKGSAAEQFARSAWYAAETFVPLSLGSVSGAVRTGEKKPSDVKDLALTGVSQFFGHSLYESSPSERRNQWSRDHFGKDYFDLDAGERERAKLDPAIAALSEEIDRRQRERGDELQGLQDKFADDTQALREEQALDDRAFAAGRMDVETWKENNRERAGEISAIRRSVFADAPAFDRDTDAESQPVQAALDRYFAVSPDSYMDEATREIEWDRFFDAREAALRGLTPGQQREAQAVITKNLTPLQLEFREASDLYGRLRRTVPKYKGVSVEQAREIDRFVFGEVPDETARLEKAERRDYTEREVAQMLAQRRGRPALYNWYDTLRSAKKREAALNPAYDEYLLEHQEELERWFPDLYSPAFYRRTGLIPAEEDEDSGLTPLDEPGTGGLRPVEELVPVGVR